MSLKVTDEHREIAKNIQTTPDKDGWHIVVHRLLVEPIAKALAQRDEVMIEKCAAKAEGMHGSNNESIAKAIRALGEK